MLRDPILRELTLYDRRYLLWELDSRNSMGKLSFHSTVAQYELASAPVEQQVQAYVQDLDSWFRSLAADDQYRLWLDDAEQRYGAVVDAVFREFDDYRPGP